MTDKPLSEYLTVGEVMEATGLSKSAVHYHLDHGAFPGAQQIGSGRTNSILIPWSDIENWSPDRPGPKTNEA